MGTIVLRYTGKGRGMAITQEVVDKLEAKFAAIKAAYASGDASIRETQIATNRLLDEMNAAKQRKG